MNIQYTNTFRTLFILGLSCIALTSCNKFLDRAPLSSVPPHNYLNTEDDLATYTQTKYNFPTHGGWGVGTFANDNGTDNQATTNAASRWIPGDWRVSQTGGDWSFDNIYQINYFIQNVIPRWKSNTIAGSASNVEHYIGEAYFLRAYEYFNKLQVVGDFPIVKTTHKDNLEELTAASVRRPRNEVARFILSDLDSAITLLKDASPVGGKRRITKNVALLMKSRVGLYEGSWLKYHAGTAFVPGGPSWPGAASNPNFTLDIDQESKFFLAQAKDAAQKVADAVKLTTNTYDNGYNSSSNPYFQMFSDADLNPYQEVLFWRSYDLGLGVTHSVNHYMNRNGGNTGFTKGLIENFTMANGLPIYAANSGYAGDDSIQVVKKNRDNRLQLFVKSPGDLSFTDQLSATGKPLMEGYPDIIGMNETKYVTGYPLKKGFSYIFKYSEGSTSISGAIIFRAAEAYLNYIEASYLLTGALDGKAIEYWKEIRKRGGVDEDYTKTVQATDMQKEAEVDFAAYSNGQLLTDKVLYNIRRERRLELIAEGFRFNDLKRWRALDQLATKPYLIEGVKVWGPMKKWFDDKDGVTKLIQPGTAGKTANVSLQSESQYLRPYRINTASSNLVRDGYSWISAHYLSPIAITHFTITSADGNPANSIIYQNPGWPLVAGQGAK